jgi:hypothetical protein
LDHKYSIRKISQALSDVTSTDKKQGISEISNKSDVYKDIEKSFQVESLLDYDYTNVSNVKRYRKEIKRYKI